MSELTKIGIGWAWDPVNWRLAFHWADEDHTEFHFYAGPFGLILCYE